MACWERKAVLLCTVSCLVLSVGPAIFTLIFLYFKGNEIAEKNDVNSGDGGTLLKDAAPDPGDCQSGPVCVLTGKRVPPGRFDYSNSVRAWSAAEQRAKEPRHVYMERVHSVAIYAYTTSTSLTLGLSFYLSRALQILKHSQVSCLLAYRRTGTSYNITGDRVCFDTFVSATTDPNPPLDSLRNASSCFEIYTCFGAEITYYSASNLNGQMLIPPYEVFRVVSVETDGRHCKEVYKLKSIQNCVYDVVLNRLHSISAMHPDGMRAAAIAMCVVIVIVAVVIACLLMAAAVLKVLKRSPIYSVSSLSHNPYSSPGVKV